MCVAGVQNVKRHTRQNDCACRSAKGQITCRRKQRVCVFRRQSSFLGQIVEQLVGRVTSGRNVVPTISESDGDKFPIRDEPWHLNIKRFVDAQTNRSRASTLDRDAGRFAITHGRMQIAQGKQSATNLRRKPD